MYALLCSPLETAAEAVILEAVLRHFGRVEKIAAIEDEGAAHGLRNAGPVKFAKLGPLGEDEQCVGVAGDAVRIAAEFDLGENGGSFVHGLLVVGAKIRTFSEQASDDFERGRKANVVGIGFEREAQDTDLFVLDDPKSLANFFDEQIDAALVDLLGFFEHVEIDAGMFGEADKSLNVLGQAEAAEAKSRIQELAADARIEPHGVDNFLNIGSDSFTQVGNHVGVGNFQGEERVGGVLDEFGAVDGGEHELGRFRGRAAAQVNGALEFCFQDGTVDFAELFFGVFVFDAEDDTIGMKKVLDSGAFA